MSRLARRICRKVNENTANIKSASVAASGNILDITRSYRLRHKLKARDKAINIRAW